MAVAGSTYKKKNIPKAVREALWIQYYPSKFRAKCQTTWCPNQITAFDFQAGHNIPESKGGATSLENLVPICSRCNSSMGNQYTFIEWCQFHSSKKSFVQKLFSCLTIPPFRREVSISNPSILPTPLSDMPPTSVSDPKVHP